MPDHSDAPSRPFNYNEAFSRNIGWVTDNEQAALRSKTVAIAGCGGVGGAYLLTLARLGVGSFRIADFDQFDIPNFNRQSGASMSTVDQPKASVLAKMARDINPEINIQIFSEGVNESNLPDFLKGADLYLDGLDFFAFDIRQKTFALCHALGVPATTVAPLGMGAALLNFMPGGMSFERYFQWGARSELDKAIRFVVGLAPAGLHRAYLVDPSSVNFEQRKGPSTIIGVQLCAGIAAAEALKILLGRGQVIQAPRGVQFDGYRNTIKRTWRPGGNANPIQRLTIAVAKLSMSLAKLKTRKDARSLPPGKP